MSEAFTVQITLSAQETQLIRFVCEGLSTKELAKRLHVSVRTVKYHLEKVRYKLGLDGRDRGLLVAWAFRNGVVK